MKTRLVLFLLIFVMLLAPAGLFAAATLTSTSTGGSSSSTTSADTLSDIAVLETIRPMLESYARRSTDEQVRIWSTIILANLNNLSTGTSSGTSTSGTSSGYSTSNSSTSSSSSNTGGISSAAAEINNVLFLVRQLSSRDEMIRMIAMDSLRRLLDLDDDSWRGIMTPVLINLVKKAKYPEAKKMALKAFGKIRQLDGETLRLLPTFFDLAQNDDADIRESANASIEEMLAGSSSGRVGIGGQFGAPGTPPVGGWGGAPPIAPY